MSDAFLQERTRLWGLAYRILGSRADADDAVQEAWLRWERADRTVIERPAAWLTTVTSRLALDRLRARRRELDRYVGPWLPEPVLTEGVEETAELAESLTVGFLALLERLEPTERVVFLLAEVFEEPYADIAGVVGKSPAACRQIAARARRRVHDEHRGRRNPVPRHEQERLVSAFSRAAFEGDLAGLAALLTPDAVLVSDGGPERHAARRPVVGADKVARFVANVAQRLPAGLDARFGEVNGEPGLVFSRGHCVELTVVFHITELGIGQIFIMLNPDKLHGLH